MDCFSSVGSGSGDPSLQGYGSFVLRWIRIRGSWSEIIYMVCPPWDQDPGILVCKDMNRLSSVGSGSGDPSLDCSRYIFKQILMFFLAVCSSLFRGKIEGKTRVLYSSVTGRSSVTQTFYALTNYHRKKVHQINLFQTVQGKCILKCYHCLEVAIKT